MSTSEHPPVLPSLAQLLDQSPLTVTPDTRVSEAIRQIPPDQAVCILVAQDKRFLGLFTEQNLRRLIMMGYGTETPIAEVMTRDNITLKRTQAEDSATVSFLLQQVRYLPILDEHDQLLGLITQERWLQALNLSLLNLSPPGPAFPDPASPAAAWHWQREQERLVADIALRIRRSLDLDETLQTTVE
jgi:CBS domain-containing protein